MYFGGSIVSLNTPQELQEENAEGLSIWLYQIERDPDRLNDRPIRPSAEETVPPPLPLRLHYLMTPITDRTKPLSPQTEQVVLGKVLQALHTRPVLYGADLRDEFIGTDVELHLRLEALGLEEITRVWEALHDSYQLSVSYEVSVVNICSEAEPQAVSPVRVTLPEYGVITSDEAL
jgi:hypothetical protein